MGVLSRVRRVAVRHRVVDDLVLASGSLVVYALAYLVDHRVRYLFGDSATYLTQARAWHLPGPFPFIRERADLFTILWAPFVAARHGAAELMALNAVATIAAAVALCRGLRRLEVRRRWALLTGFGATVAPYVVYAQRLVLSEPLSYAVMLGIMALLCWACRPVRWWRLALVALATMLANGALRPSFQLTWVAGLIAALLAAAWLGWRRRPDRRTVLRWAAWAAALLVGGVAGAIGISTVQGAVSDVSPTAQLRNQSAYSGIQLIATYGSLVPCGHPVTHVERSVCATVGPSGTHADTRYNDYVWQGPVHRDWATPDDAGFLTVATAYRSLALHTILAHPGGAARIALTNAVQLLDPITVERFMEEQQTFDPGPDHARGVRDRHWLRAVHRAAPALPIRERWGPAATDWVYLAASWEAHSRVLLALAALVLLVVRRRRVTPLAAILLGTWTLNVLGLAMTSAPTTRYLLVLDPLLLTALALAATARGPVRDVPVPAEPPASGEVAPA